MWPWPRKWPSTSPTLDWRSSRTRATLPTSKNRGSFIRSSNSLFSRPNEQGRSDMDLLERFAETLSTAEAETLRHVHDYVEWQAGRGGSFAPSADDDVDLRDYLLHLRTSGGGRKNQR